MGKFKPEPKLLWTNRRGTKTRKPSQLLQPQKRKSKTDSRISKKKIEPKRNSLFGKGPKKFQRRQSSRVHPVTSTFSLGSVSSATQLNARRQRKGCGALFWQAKETFREHRDAVHFRLKQREIDEAKANAFKKITVEKIHYTSLLVKEDRLRIKDIPLKATTVGNTYTLNRWYNCCCCKHPQPVTEAPKYPDDDSISDSDYEVKITEKQWRTDLWTQIPVFALSFSASNLFRFPYDCYVYGGSTFFGLYMIIMIVLMQPLIYLEMLIGQFSQTGVSGFAELHLYARGLPMAIVFMSLVFVPYNDMVLGYAGAYAFGAIYRRSEKCDPSWNKLELCFPYQAIRRRGNSFPPNTTIWFKNSTTVTGLLSSELYFRQYILSQHWHGGTNQELGGWNPKIFVGLLLTYFIVFFCTMDYLTSKCSKVIVVAAFIVPVAVLVLIGSQYFSEGAAGGMIDFLYPDWTVLGFEGFWADAFRHAISTLGVGYGLFPRIASKNLFTFGKLYRTSWIVCLTTGLFSGLTCLVVFTELGIIKNAFHLSDYKKIFAERTGIGFIVISGALMKLGRIWPTILFFTIFNVAGIWPQIVATETCLSYLVRWLPRKFKLRTMRRVCILIVISTQFLCALLTSRSGSGAHMLDSPQLFEGSWPACFVALTEVLVVIYLYGFKLFAIDTEVMQRHSLPKLFQIQLKYTCPLFLLIGLVLLGYEDIIRPTRKYLGTVPTPTWLKAVGYTLNIIPVLLVVGFGIYSIRKSIAVKSLNKKNFRPGDEHLAKMYERLRTRRGNIMEAGKEDEFREDSQIAAFRRRYQIYMDLKITLFRLMVHRRAISLWQRSCNKLLVAERKVNTFYKLIRWTVREQDIMKNRKEVIYIEQILACASLENLFISSELEDHGSKAEDFQHLVDRHLSSVSKSKLNISYKPLTHYQIMVGKRNPVPEEDKLSIIIRIKRHLNLPTRKDQAALNKIVQRENARSLRMSIYREDTPLQFYFKYYTERVRVIVVNGENHSLLKNLPQPKPRMIIVGVDEITHASTTEGALNYFKALVVANMKKNGFSPFKSLVRLAVSTPSLIRALVSSPKVSKLRLEEQKTLRELPNWYYMTDLRQYKIIPSETWIVIVEDKGKAEESDPYRWLTLDERRKIWPNLDAELAEPGDKVVQATLLDLAFPGHLHHENEKSLRLSAPAEILFHAPKAHARVEQDLELGHQSNLQASSSSSSDSSGFLTLKVLSGSSFVSEPTTGASGSGSGSSGSESSISTPSISSKDSLKLQSDDSFELAKLSETDLRYLHQTRKTRQHMLYPPQVHSETALDEAKATATGGATPLISRSHVDVESILEPKSPILAQDESAAEDDEPKLDKADPVMPHKKRHKKKPREPKEQPKLKGRRQPSAENLEILDSSSSGSESVDEKDSRKFPVFTGLELLDLLYDDGISTRSVWSQASVSAQVQGLGASRRNSHNILHAIANYKYTKTKDTKLQGWNQCEHFIYRPQGKMLIVERIDDSTPVIVFAQPGDSIASVGPMIAEEESRLTIRTRHRNTLQARVLGTG